MPSNEYEVYRPLYGQPRRLLPRPQALLDHQHFVKTIPERLQFLRSIVPLTITLKYEVANLRLLQEWFIDQLTSRAHLVDGIPDSLSLSLCHDVGLYLGETVRQELPQLKWTLRTLRRDDLYFQHSVLSGFSDPQKCIDFFFVLTRGLNLVIQGKGFPEKHQFDFMIKTIINHERNPFY